MRKIIHIDMDCFYAAVEMRDNPTLRDQPIAVGGAANARGVLTTCNYEARKFGCHSAMPTARALQLCPDLVLLPVAMDKYRVVSADIHAIFHDYTNIIEPLSLDEAYLEVTDSLHHKGSATLIAEAIRHEIAEKVCLSASAGIAPNKFLAKVASDWRKPNGQFVILPEDIADFMRSLPIKKIPGVGKVTAKKLQDKGIHTCGELQALSQATMVDMFGKFGQSLYQYCRGEDERAVEPKRVRKSLSVENTYLQDLKTLDACQQRLPTLFSELQMRLEKQTTRRIHKQFIKIKFADFTQMTRECMVEALHFETFTTLLSQAEAELSQPVRLIGVGVRFAETEEPTHKQGALF